MSAGDAEAAVAMADRYGLDAMTAATLQRYGFDPVTFDQLRSRVGDRAHDGDASAADNRVRGNIEPPNSDDLVALPPPDSAERGQFTDAGREAIALGRVGVLLLAGGMATRFGGGVKALAEVLDGLTFVDAKLADLRRLARELDCSIPLTLMTSFQSDDALASWAETAALSTGSGEPRRVPVGLAPQGVSMRLRADGELFRDDTSGAVSLHAPGHGEAPWAMRRAGILDQFAADGGRHIFVTNVDNATATLDPAVIGAHLVHERPLSCEVVAGEASGGAPWRVDGHLQILESFRLPSGIDPTAAGAVNTNSLVVDVEVFAAQWPLTWFEVRKRVGPDEVVQFERLIGELSAFVDTTMLLVDRDGPDGRFQPVKDPAELAARRREIADILTARGVIS
ncbi:UTP--glucose-1-phosphate uridylyltransferase [Candidatus Poriferisodalis sp.]|uniref:UTP--glucose-1-phosphate uridylyltransferase n=1 Tax=Candidatus Poriferisodalis sp. TaxID=3101277 RepID=UPI003B01E85F